MHALTPGQTKAVCQLNQCTQTPTPTPAPAGAAPPVGSPGSSTLQQHSAVHGPPCHARSRARTTLGWAGPGSAAICIAIPLRPRGVLAGWLVRDSMRQPSPTASCPFQRDRQGAISRRCLAGSGPGKGGASAGMRSHAESASGHVCFLQWLTRPILLVI